MFEKGRGGMKKRTWKWKRIKEIKEIKYLEYTLSKNEGAESILEKGENNSSNEKDVERDYFKMERDYLKMISGEDVSG